MYKRWGHWTFAVILVESFFNSWIRTRTVSKNQSNRFRLEDPGILRASRYLATVRREISTSSAFNKSANF